MVDVWDGDELDKLARDLFGLPLWMRARIMQSRRYKPVAFAPPDDTPNHYDTTVTVAFHGRA
jgi:hypothetical protein